jgi:hypothetical protein
LKIAKSIVALNVLACFQPMLSASYVQLAGLPVVAKKTRNNSTMNDNQDRWPEPVFSTLSAGLAWAFFSGIVAASIGTFLYFSYWFITEIVDNGR